MTAPRMPISCRARSTRTAISPRLAISTLRMRRFGGLALRAGWRSSPAARRAVPGIGRLLAPSGHRPTQRDSAIGRSSHKLDVAGGPAAEYGETLDCGATQDRGGERA